MASRIWRHRGWACLTLFLGFAATLIQAHAQQRPPPAWAPQWTPAGELRLPTGYRDWVFLGAPLTPNALNNGAAGFPEFHNVYLPREVLDAYLRTGDWAEGAIWVKELQLTLPAQRPDGARVESSGVGYFPGAFNGLDVMVKDSRRCGETRGWCFFNFGHRPPPYNPVAQVAPRASCSGCHEASADPDLHFKRFYAILQRPQR